VSDAVRRYLVYLALLFLLPVIGFQVGAAAESSSCAKQAKTEYVECDLSGLAGLSAGFLAFVVVLAVCIGYEVWGAHRRRPRE
jgi:hypothetical protein